VDQEAARVSDLPTITIDLPYRALPKANMHKIAKRAGSRRRRVVNDLTGALAQAEESFVTQALAVTEDRDDLPWNKDCAIEAKVTFVYVPTASWSQWMIKAAHRGSFRYVKTPDLENVAKFVFDALEGVYYADDKLIFRQTLEKRYGPEERVIVTLIKHPQATAKTWQELPW
jgi:Holliday junction resolvase RusA-like endonuclease